MQGMPAKLTTTPAVKTAVKGDVKTPATTVVNGKVVPVQTNAVKAASGATPEIQGEKSKEQSQGSFADLFSGLVGNEANKVEGKGEKVEKLPAQMAEEVKAQASAESKIDALLKNKGQGEQIAKGSENKVMSAEQALSPEVLQNINNLLVKAPPADDKAPVAKEAIGDKVAKSSSNLDQLLKTLKGENAEGSEAVEGQPEVKDAKNTKSSPLDFLLKQSKESDVGSVQSKEGKLLNSNPEVVSKLGLSSEDFVSHMGTAKKDSKEVKDKNGKVIDLDGQMMDQKDIKAFANTSVKSYGQKQNLLDNGLIKNTHDLAFKENKSKASSDELKTPELKIGSEFSNAKDPFIAVANNKQEQAPQMDTQNAGKVLDISKMDTANHTEIIKRISDYVQQNQVANSNSLDLTVKHDSLGQFKIQVNKPMDPRSNQMDMQITTSTKEGHDFFVKNEIGLMKNLNQAGIQLSDLRIVSGGENTSFAQNDSRQSGHNSQQAPREFMSFENGDFSQGGSDRRRELWQEARANQQRYGA